MIEIISFKAAAQEVINTANRVIARTMNDATLSDTERQATIDAMELQKKHANGILHSPQQGLVNCLRSTDGNLCVIEDPTQNKN